MEPQFLTKGQFRNTFWAPPELTLRTQVWVRQQLLKTLPVHSVLWEDQPHKSNSSGGTKLGLSQLRCLFTDGELTWALPRAAPADTHLKELESLNIIPPLGNYLLVATGGEKGALVPGRVTHQKLNLRNIVKIWPLWNSVPLVQCPSGKWPLSMFQKGFLSSHSITIKILPRDWSIDFFSPLDLKKTCHMLIIC